MSSSIVVEWAPFELAPGVTEAQLLAASRVLQQEFLARQSGFVHRELLRGRDGRWVDLVHWADADAAERAMQAANESATCRTYFGLMAGSESAGTGVLHLERVVAYAPA